MEVDLLDKGIDLLDWHRGRLSTRRLALLVAELPTDSRVITEYRRRAAGHDDPFFSQQEYILADIYDVVQHMRWLTEAVLAARGGNDAPQHPERYPRPGERAPEAEPIRFATTDELSAFFGAT